MSDLARLLRDHPRFVWGCPMGIAHPRALLFVGKEPRPVSGWGLIVAGQEALMAPLANFLPDLDHPGTHGALLGWLVESGRFRELITFSPGDLGAPRTWAVYYRDQNDRTASAVENSIGEALARAVLAVWGPA